VEPRILVMQAGPYIVEGGVPLIRIERDEDGVWQERDRVDHDDTFAMCRCGNLEDPPTCKTLERRGFVSVPRPVKWDVPISSPSVAIKPNGPLRVRDLPLAGDDGTVFEHADRFSLCRCGRSNTQPFCDGTHKEVGFHG